MARFVFDCRGILNPGRIKEFKSRPARQGSKDFLEQQTRMPNTEQRTNIVDISVEDYIKRGFESLSVNLDVRVAARSVYAADALQDICEISFM